MLGSDPGPRRSQSFVSDFRQATSQVSSCGLPPRTLENPKEVWIFRIQPLAIQALREEAGHFSAPFLGYPKIYFVPSHAGVFLSTHTKPPSPRAARTVDTGYGLSLCGRGQRAALSVTLSRPTLCFETLSQRGTY